MDAAQRQPAEVGRGVEVGDVRLQRRARRHRSEPGSSRGWCGTARRDPSRRAAAPSAGAVSAGPAGLRRGVDDGEVDLALVGVEVEEQLVGLVDDLGDPRVRPVDLVDDEHHRQPGLERLAQHEPGLRQRSLGGVHQQQHAVDHGQAALDLAAEVGVAGRVDDVDRDPAAVGSDVIDRGVLGEDGDALLALEVVGVEHPLVDLTGVGLVLGERSGLPEHRVDESRLAVVDVGDDRDVAKIVAPLDRHAATSIQRREGNRGSLRGVRAGRAYRTRAV